MAADIKENQSQSEAQARDPLISQFMFSMQIAGIRNLMAEVVPHAKSVDDTNLGKIRKMIQGLSNSTPEQAESEDSKSQSSDSHFGGKRIRPHAGSEEPTSSEFSSPKTEPAAASTDAIFEIIKGVIRRPPFMAASLRSSALIMLVTQFESLISELLHFLYEVYPGMLNLDGKSISLAEIKEIGSIADAERAIIDRIIEGQLNEPIEAQLEFFRKEQKVDLDPLAPFLDDLFEIVLRRNLWVHNSGVVNRIYLKKVSDRLKRQYEAERGKTLTVSAEYLESAISNVYIAGTLLLQQCWRKWSPDKVRVADGMLVHEAESCKEHSYLRELVALCEYSMKINMSSDFGRNIMLLHGIEGYSKLGEAERARELISMLSPVEGAGVFLPPDIPDSEE